IIERLPALEGNAASGAAGVDACAPERRHPDDQAAGTWELRGVDLFVQHEGLPTLPEQVGKFKLTMMSNRGTKVYPGPCPDILLVDWHRGRYVADAPVSDRDVMAFLNELPQD